MAYHCNYCKHSKAVCAMGCGCEQCHYYCKVIHCPSCAHPSKTACRFAECTCTGCGCAIGTLKLGLGDSSTIDDVLAQDHNEKSLDPNQLLGPTDLVIQLANLYVADHLGLEDLRDRLAETLGSRLLYYILLASGGEARHCAEQNRMQGYNLGESLSLDARTLGGIVTTTSQRLTSWALVKALSDIWWMPRTLSAIEEIHSLPWVHGYGGPLWAKVARWGRYYAEGRVDNYTFVDGCVNLVHNSGWAFGKWYSSFHQQVGRYVECPHLELDGKTYKPYLHLADVLRWVSRDITPLLGMTKCLHEEIYQCLNTQTTGMRSSDTGDSTPPIIKVPEWGPIPILSPLQTSATQVTWTYLPVEESPSWVEALPEVPSPQPVTTP